MTGHYRRPILTVRTYSFFSSDVSSVKDNYLLTPAIQIPQDGSLSFWHTYAFEQFGDGAVIEISFDGGSTFVDLGPQILQGQYTTQIAAGWGSPISGRMAWSGGSLGAMTEVRVDLSPYEGQTAILRFRLACDSGDGGHGWYVDDVQSQRSQYQPDLQRRIRIRDHDGLDCRHFIRDVPALEDPTGQRAGRLSVSRPAASDPQAR